MRPRSLAPAAETGGPGAAIRDAATIILWRPGPAGPEVLMGQRGKGAAFMPEKVVFPGGAVDPEDAGLPFPALVDPDSARRLMQDAGSRPMEPILLAGIRELWEEAGLRLALPCPDPLPALPPSWQDFAAGGFRPHTEALRFVFRAITPPGRPRRFDARFFLAEARMISDLAEDFAAASGELDSLRWVPLAATHDLPLPFITGIVLAEVEARLGAPDRDHPVPFFDNRGADSRFCLL